MSNEPAEAAIQAHGRANGPGSTEGGVQEGERVEQHTG